MDRTLHLAMARHAGRWRTDPLPGPREADEGTGWSAGCAVYVVGDYLDQVLYVGSVHRPDDERGLALRIAEHLRAPAKRLRWRRVWAIPLRPEVPETFVRGLEGVVGAELAPTWSRRLPRLGP